MNGELPIWQEVQEDCVHVEPLLDEYWIEYPVIAESPSLAGGRQDTYIDETVGVSATG